MPLNRSTDRHQRRCEHLGVQTGRRWLKREGRCIRGSVPSDSSASTAALVITQMIERACRCLCGKTGLKKVVVTESHHVGGPYEGIITVGTGSA